MQPETMDDTTGNDPMAPGSDEPEAPTRLAAIAKCLVRRKVLVLLTVILLTGAGLRLVRLTEWPPGLHQDEAIRAWNAQCYLETGRDHRGTPWPVYYTNAFGSNTSTLHDYMLVPFQALTGLNIWTCRYPGVLAGLLSVLLLYAIGSRMFSPDVGLVAAALLAVSPWAVQADRTGMGVSITGPVVPLVLLLLIWAGAPLLDRASQRLRPLVAVSAGAIAGISCYGYPAWRLFMPCFVLALLVATCRGWFRLLVTRRGAMVVAGFALAMAATFGPLAWKQLTDARSSRAGSKAWVWEEGDSPGQKAARVAGRYWRHFGPDFLFLRGDQAKIVSPPHGGQLHWYMLPMLLGGAGIAIWKARSSRAARVLLAWVLIYPAGDLFFARPLPGGTDPLAMHSLRSLPGMGALYLLAAMGAVGVGMGLYRWRRKVAMVLGGLLLAGGLAWNAVYYPFFFRDFARDPDVYHTYHADLVEATEWLQPRLKQYDAVFCTAAGMNQPYMIMLVILNVSPDDWFSQVRDFREVSFARDGCVRWGKFHWMYWDLYREQFRALRENGKPDRVLLILRPGEFGLQYPTHVINRPDGTAALWLFERDL